MKKFTILGLVLVLLAFSVAPVMAAGHNNGHGNGNGGNTGQGNASGDRDQTKKQDRIHSNQGRSKNSINTDTSTNLGLRKPFYLQGTIVSVDYGAMTLTVAVHHGNSRVKEYIGGTEDLLVTATNMTRIFKIMQGQDGEDSGTSGTSAGPSVSSGDESTTSSENGSSANPHSIPFTDLHAGDIVAIHGLVLVDGFGATKITVFSQGIGGLPEASQP